MASTIQAATTKKTVTSRNSEASPPNDSPGSTIRPTFSPPEP